MPGIYQACGCREHRLSDTHALSIPAGWERCPCGISSTEWPIALLYAGLDIGNFACGNEVTGPIITEVDDQISVVATAAVKAIAQFNASCLIQGNTRASLNGSASSSARAVAYAEAVSNVLVSNDVCPNCTAVVNAVARTSGNIVAEAVSFADITVHAHQSVLFCSAPQASLHAQVYLPCRLDTTVCLLLSLVQTHTFLRP